MFGHSSWLRRWCGVVLFCFVLGIGLCACGTETKSEPPTTAPFKVTSVEITTSPSLAGYACGSQLTETYTAIFHLAPNGPGGSIIFQYTTNNGRSSSPDVSLSVAAGQTTAMYQFTWSGQLPADHTAPGNGGVQVSSPNALISPLVAPSGSCSNAS